MPNKTITAIIGIVVIVVANLFTMQENAITYTGMVAIASLGGVSIYRNNHPKK